MFLDFVWRNNLFYGYSMRYSRLLFLVEFIIVVVNRGYICFLLLSLLDFFNSIIVDWWFMKKRIFVVKMELLFNLGMGI